MNRYLVTFSALLMGRTGNSYRTIEATVLEIDAEGSLLFYKRKNDASPFVVYAQGAWLSVEAEEAE